MAYDDDELDRILRLACDHLGMEAAFVSELTSSRQIFRALSGSADSFGLVPDEGPERTETYCDLLVTGRLPRVVRDTGLEPRVKDLAATAAAPIGAYVGVPLTLSDGRLYGTFCCLSHTPELQLDERDAKFMDLLAEMIAARVEVLEAARQQHDEIRDLLAAQAVDIALQPIINLATGQWSGTEALARFPGSGRRVDEIFALANEAGLGPDLELLCLRLALDRLSDLPASVYLSVNMSPNGIADPRFAATMATCPALDQVVLEVTEHAPVDKYAALLAALAPLRAAGVRLAVDDVGAGYASFRHVLQLHPDILKIDRSLVEGIAGDRALRSLAGNLVLLALDLRAVVIAEGVETSADLDVLGTLGVDMAQGYLFAPPTTDPAVWARWAAELPQGPVQPGRGPAAAPAASNANATAPRPRVGERPDFRGCRTATTMTEACDNVVDDLLVHGYTMPSVYVVADGTLRCQAARGYFQVVDGFGVGVGVVGRIAATGHPVLIPDVSNHAEFIAAVPDVVAEAGVPVWVGGRIAAVVNVESTGALPGSTLDVLRTAADELGAWMTDHGGIPRAPVQERLLRICHDLAALNDQGQIEQRALDGLLSLSEQSSAAIVRRGGGDGAWTVTAAMGPLADAVRRWSAVELECMAGWVTQSGSSHQPRGQQPPPGYPFLARAEVRSLTVLPLSTGGELMGLLLVLDRRQPVQDGENVRPLLEQLATSTAVALRAAGDRTRA
jgi:EAL domain-containing protein (putative c-di-GMP-specific phosphodiesterase class I)/putative methionine-R-sulfoxide reductase with GAF domain